MHEDFNFRIEKKDGILEIISNSGGNSCNRSLYLSYENALWLINKLRPMTFEELTNNLKFDTKKEIVDFKYNVLFPNIIKIAIIIFIKQNEVIL